MKVYILEMDIDYNRYIPISIFTSDDLAIRWIKDHCYGVQVDPEWDHRSRDYPSKDCYGYNTQQDFDKYGDNPTSMIGYAFKITEMEVRETSDDRPGSHWFDMPKMKENREKLSISPL